MTPPELAADAPVAQVLVPGLIHLCIPRREEPQFTVTGCPSFLTCARRLRPFKLLIRHRALGFADQPIIRHLHVPLIAQVRLDRDMRSITVPDTVFIRLDRLQQRPRLELLDDLLPRIFTTHADEQVGIADIFPSVGIGDGSIRGISSRSTALR